jgi:hypothetical protein
VGEDNKPVMTLGAESRQQIRETLISWFEINERDLPWRHTRDPWRVLVELRKASHAGSEGLTLRELGGRAKQDFDERDSHWLRVAVESLCADGLAKIASGPAGAPGMVAEERAPYGAGSEQSQSPSLDQAVGLP